MWQIFQAVAKMQNFRQAARTLSISVPTVSKKIASLESQLQTKLFHRTTRKVSLTESGRELVPLVQNAMESMSELESHIEEDAPVAGNIRIACLSGLAHRHLSHAILKFRRTYPDVEFDLLLSDHLIDLIENSIDVAIRVQEPQGADFIYRKLIENRLIVCASPKFLNQLKSIPKSPKDLAGLPLLSLPQYRKLRFLNSDYFVKDFDQNRKIRVDSGLFLTELAVRGAGVAIRSVWDVQPFLEQGKLRPLLPHYPLENLGNIYAVTPPGRKISKKLRLFLNFLLEESKRWDKQ
jgi:DNA-binding transcriptional LysR family regulator